MMLQGGPFVRGLGDLGWPNNLVYNLLLVEGKHTFSPREE